MPHEAARTHNGSDEPWTTTNYLQAGEAYHKWHDGKGYQESGRPAHHNKTIMCIQLDPNVPCSRSTHGNRLELVTYCCSDQVFYGASEHTVQVQQFDALPPLPTAGIEMLGTAWRLLLVYAIVSQMAAGYLRCEETCRRSPPSLVNMSAADASRETPS